MAKARRIMTGYSKRLVVDLRRTKHFVVFNATSTCQDVRDMLKNVPDSAGVDEVTVDDFGNVSIEFHQEEIVGRKVLPYGSET